MSVDVLGHGVHHNVGTVVERVLDVRAHKGVVDHNEDAMAMRHGGHFLNIHETQGRVGRGFDPHQLRLGSDQLLHIALQRGGEGDIDTVGGGHLSEVAMGATVDIGDGDDVRTGGERLENDGGGGRTGGESEGIAGILQRGDSLLKVIPTRVRLVCDGGDLHDRRSLTGWGWSSEYTRRGRPDCRPLSAQR